jgi:hypothetical protein
MASVVLIVVLLWWISVKTASRYEARTSVARPELNEGWPLTQPGFWRGEALVGRQRALHAAAALASVALIAVLPASHPAAARWVAIILAAAVLAAAVVSVTLPLADRHTVTLANGGRPEGRADRWCLGVLAAALAALVASAVVCGLTDSQPGRQPGVLPGLTGFLAGLLIVQAVLLIALAVAVAALARRARDADVGRTALPYLGGQFAVPVMALGFSVGGLLTAVINVGVARLLGTAGPSGFQFQPAPPDALAVPWAVYAFAVAPIGLLCGAVAAAIVLFGRYVRRHRQFGAQTGDGRSPVADAYAASTAGPVGSNGDDPAYAGNRRAIARAWAAGLIIDDADIAITLAAGGILVLVLATEIAAAVYAGTTGHPALLSGIWHGAASVVALVAITAIGWLVTLLRQAYSDPAKRKTIGALWDVGTFWPRAVHPLAPPCYAERAVPEVVDRIRLLTGYETNAPDDIANLHHQAELPGLESTHGLTVPACPLLLTGYSQGSIIAAAVIAQLPPESLPGIALLSLACPARRPYGRAFPAYFGPRPLAELASLLDAASGQPAGRWKNLRRRSDYFGSFVFSEPEPSPDDATLRAQVDQPCLDPPVLVPDINPTPPPTHRHDQWWPDPRTSEVGSYLVGLLSPSPGNPRSLSGTDGGACFLRSARHPHTARTRAGIFRACSGLQTSAGSLQLSLSERAVLGFPLVQGGSRPFGPAPSTQPADSVSAGRRSG